MGAAFKKRGDALCAVSTVRGKAIISFPPNKLSAMRYFNSRSQDTDIVPAFVQEQGDVDGGEGNEQCGGTTQKTWLAGQGGNSFQ
jgi:hypothetical protein